MSYITRQPVVDGKESWTAIDNHRVSPHMGGRAKPITSIMLSELDFIPLSKCIWCSAPYDCLAI